MFGKPIPCKVV